MVYEAIYKNKREDVAYLFPVSTHRFALHRGLLLTIFAQDSRIPQDVSAVLREMKPPIVVDESEGIIYSYLFA